MATVDVPTTYKETLALLERWEAQAPTEDEVKTFLEKSNGSLRNPQAAEDVKTRYSDLANAAVKMNNAFDQINRTLGRIAAEYQGSVPELAVYYMLWQGYKTRWDTNLRQSRDLASASALNLQGYDMILERITQGPIITEQDMNDAIRVLRDFSAGMPPVQISPDLAQQFLDLRSDVNAYQRIVSQYLEARGIEALKILFDALGQSFQIIGSSLPLFSEVWALFRNESLVFANMFEQLLNSTLPRLFVLRANLAREVCGPLRDSLNLYASTIQNYEASVEAEKKE